eukprot:TRINITY_DN105095_c2_g1_i1.p1 TRINITY_DN105095_c2_g1~~TRINITY_DN105095_c2_g1_i1.p1  ORF type:complete len:1013 (+),score=68.10 TRINITY_DN105095_c2_g1_i1:1553-4591(+)
MVQSTRRNLHKRMYGCKSQQVIDKPVRRWAHTATILGETMYIYGGCGDKSINFKEVMQFSLNNCEWTVLKASNKINPPPRDSHVSFGYKGKLYVFGGTTSNTRLNDLWEFDIEKKAWREIKAAGTAPVVREAHSATFIPENTALIFGGKSPGEKLADAHILTIDYSKSSLAPTLAWNLCTQTGQLPCPRDGHSMCTIGKNVYLFGGENNEKLMLNDLYVGTIDRSKGYKLNWKKCEQKNPPRARRAATLCSYMDEYLILIGGEAYEEAATSTLNDVWIYSIINGVWEEVFSMPRVDTGDYFPPRAYHAAAIFESNLYVFGGISHTGQILDDFFVLSLNGEPPKSLESMQTLVPSIISGKDGRALMSSTKKVQYFTQYIQDTPFPTTSRETGERKISKWRMDKNSDDSFAFSNLGISPEFPLELSAENDWPIGAFGNLFNAVEDLTGNNRFKVDVVIPFIQAQAGSQREEIKRTKIAKKDKNETEEVKTTEVQLAEKEILSEFTKKMQEDLRAQDQARMEPAIKLFAEGPGVTSDTFKDILYFFGKKDLHKTTADFAALKNSLFRIGKTMLLINRTSDYANVGLISPEYMELIHTNTFYCPYLKLTTEGGRLYGSSSALTLLDKMLKCSCVPFESKHTLLEFIQNMDNGLTFFITKLVKSGGYSRKTLILEKGQDIMCGDRGNPLKYELLDYSLRTYLRYWSLLDEYKVILEDKEETKGNPYIELEEYVKDKKIEKWVRKVDHLFDKSMGCSGFLFHKNLFNTPEMKGFAKPSALFNGILLYLHNALEVRLLGPKIGDYVGIKRELLKRKVKIEADNAAATLFEWNGYIRFTKGVKDEIMDPLFLCSLEEKILEIMEKDDAKQANQQYMSLTLIWSICSQQQQHMLIRMFRQVLVIEQALCVLTLQRSQCSCCQCLPSLRTHPLYRRRSCLPIFLPHFLSLLSKVSLPLSPRAECGPTCFTKWFQFPGVFIETSLSLRPFLTSRSRLQISFSSPFHSSKYCGFCNTLPTIRAL